MSWPNVFTGQVRHRRFLPRQHEFTYQLFMFFLDLDNLPDQLNNIKFVSYEKFNWFYFQRKKYFDTCNLDLSESVRQLVHSKTKYYPEGKIFLLTQLSCLGYCFNPISLYFVFDKSNIKLQSLVVEVANTPWGERHLYVLDKPQSPRDNIYKYSFSKQLHVSPFMAMDFNYNFNLQLSSDKIILHIENTKDSVKHFDATLNLEANPAPAIKTFLRHPLMTYKVVAGIYWQAVQLFLKRVPFVSHPTKGT